MWCLDPSQRADGESKAAVSPVTGRTAMYAGTRAPIQYRFDRARPTSGRPSGLIEFWQVAGTTPGGRDILPRSLHRPLGTATDSRYAPLDGTSCTQNTPTKRRQWVDRDAAVSIGIG